jgi:hypothetical protein
VYRRRARVKRQEREAEKLMYALAPRKSPEYWAAVQRLLDEGHDLETAKKVVEVFS